MGTCIKIEIIIRPGIGLKENVWRNLNENTLNETVVIKEVDKTKYIMRIKNEKSLVFGKQELVREKVRESERSFEHTKY